MSSPTNVTAVILCGGKGTRLKGVIPEGMPKCIAPVAGWPFLSFVLKHLYSQGVHRTILCVGGLKEQIGGVMGGQYRAMELLYSEESEPLGTAAALKNALPFLDTRQVLILNGDTYCPFVLKDMFDSASHWSSPLDARNLMTVYDESGKAAGAWLFSLGLLASLPLDVLQNILDNKGIVIPGVPYRRKGLKFHDIGTPERYAQAEAFLREQGAING